jgi:DNA-binding PadR family transcriptional regulator
LKTWERSWKSEVLEYIKLGKMYEPKPEDFVLLLAYLDGKSPIYGDEVLHFIVAIYPYVEVSLSPSFFLPFSAEVERTLKNLLDRKLVARTKQLYRGSERNIIKITEEGVDDARRLLKLFSDNWLLLRKTVVRPGLEVVNELEALKKTYNGKSVSELMRVLATKIGTEGTQFISHLATGSDCGWVSYVYYLARQISSEHAHTPISSWL